MNPRVFELKQREQYEQRTQRWYEVRETLITASSASSLLIRDKKTCENYVKEYKLDDIFDYNNKCCNPYSSEKQFMIDKCKMGTFTGNVATYWGQKYEPVVTDLYSVLSKKNVLEFGLLIHPEHKFLGASPDGITPDGIMIEIKCPFRRKITGIPPLYYYIQVQLQLEVCNLEHCDFVEYTFMEFLSKEEFMDDETLDYTILNKGVMIQVEKQDDPEIPCELSDMDYVYPPKEYLDNPTELCKWVDVQLINLPTFIDKNRFPDQTFKFTPIYWKVTDKSIVRIDRDREFFANIKDTLFTKWKQMVYYKKNDNVKKLLNKTKKSSNNGLLSLTDDEKNDPNYTECVFSDDDTDDN